MKILKDEAKIMCGYIPEITLFSEFGYVLVF